MKNTEKKQYKFKNNKSQLLDILIEKKLSKKSLLCPKWIKKMCVCVYVGVLKVKIGVSCK